MNNVKEIVNYSLCFVVLKYKNKLTVINKDISRDLLYIILLNRRNLYSTAREATYKVKVEKELLLKRLNPFNILRIATLGLAIPLY
jgi:hypothetical protein